MKITGLRLGFCLVLALTALGGYGQFFSHSVIYTRENVRFTVYLDGQRMNPMPQTRVRSINLTEPYYKLKIVFEDPRIEPLEKRMFYTHDAYGYPVALEHLLKRSKKGTWSLKWKAQEPWPGYAKPDSASYEMPPDEPPGDINAINKPKSEASCDGKATDETTFAEALESIAKLRTDASKLLLCKQFISTNCVDVAQVKKLLQQFGNETQKLEIAQYAYAYTVDKGSYHQLNNEFKDEKNIEALYRAIVK